MLAESLTVFVVKLYFIVASAVGDLLRPSMILESYYENTGTSVDVRIGGPVQSFQYLLYRISNTATFPDSN